MKCPNCLYESEQDFIFCPKCGVQVQSEQIHPQAQPILMPNINPAASRALAIVKDNLFLAMCILISIGTLFSMGVINILFTIFFWLVFAQGRKGVADVRHFRSISGAVYANYVVINVASIIIIVCGAIYLALYGYVISIDSSIIDTPITYYMPDLAELQPFADVIKNLGIGFLTFDIFLIVFSLIFIVFGVVVLLINIFAQRKIHRFAKSFYIGIQTASLEVYKPRAVKNWLIVFAVFSGLSAISSLGGNFSEAVYSGCFTAAEIIAVILIKKYLLVNSQSI